MTMSTAIKTSGDKEPTIVPTITIDAQTKSVESFDLGELVGYLTTDHRVSTFLNSEERLRLIPNLAQLADTLGYTDEAAEAFIHASFHTINMCVSALFDSKVEIVS
ncbi:MAG: hypothetical protein ACLP9L_22160 [Thermoguttaceae bacterium]